MCQAKFPFFCCFKQQKKVKLEEEKLLCKQNRFTRLFNWTLFIHKITMLMLIFMYSKALKSVKVFNITLNKYILVCTKRWLNFFYCNACAAFLRSKFLSPNSLLTMFRICESIKNQFCVMPYLSLCVKILVVGLTLHL